jgi:MFS family permease
MVQVAGGDVAPGDAAGPATDRPVDDGYPRRLLITVLLAVIAFSTSMTIVSASLPTIARDLDSTPGTLSWAVSGLFLAMAIGTPILGRLGDVHGHRPVFLAGAATLTLGTIACGLAWDVTSFVGARMVVGLGIAGTMPNGMALIMAAHAPADRPRAMGWFQMVMVGVPVIGLVIGGPMVDAFGWRTVFAVLAPLALVGFVTSWRVVRPSGGGARTSIDWWGAAMLGGAVLCFLLGLEVMKADGPTEPLAVALFVGAVVGAFAFVAVERRAAVPLLDLRYLRRPNFVGPIAAQSLSQFAYMGGFLMTPLLLDERFGLGVTAVAFVLLFRPAVYSLTSPVAGRLTGRLGERTVIVAGSVLMAASMLAFALAALVDGLVVVILGLILSGLAAGVASPAYATTVAGAVDPADLGVANGMSTTMMNLGTLTGIQLMFLLLGDDRTAGRFAFVFCFGAAVAALSALGGVVVRSGPYGPGAGAGPPAR